MELTGKCKEEFREYLLNGILDASYTYRYFITLPKSMQYGVYVDFFDSVDIRIDLISIGEPTMGGFNFFGHRFLINGFKANLTFINTRFEARKSAIEKANELHNEFLNK